MSNTFLEPMIKPYCLYIALEYPFDPKISKEQQPELLPEHLRLQNDEEQELEYTWSFMLAFPKDGSTHLKRYTIECSLDAQERCQEIGERCIPNQALFKEGCLIETSFTEPHLLGSIPKLRILLTAQFIDMSNFEEFLTTHGWDPGSGWGAHLTHLWVRQVLIDYPAVNIDQRSIMIVEEAARTFLRRDRQLHPCDFSSSSPNPQRRVRVYNMYQYAMPSDTALDAQHEFFRYTSGRWLWDEETRLRERYRLFDVHELQAVAAKSVCAEKCVDMVKLAEGGFNKVFRLVMDNGSAIIARIPNPNAGSPRWTTASEVATMDFALSILGLPVPKVLAWNMDADNPVQSEYIIMEEATGTQLSQVWDTLPLKTKLEIVKDLVNIENNLLSISFTQYGSLYFAHHGFPDCVKAQAEGNAPTSLVAEIENRYVIGPVANGDFWDGDKKTMAIDRGPWKRPQDYLRAIAQRERAWLSRQAPVSTNSLSGFSAGVDSQSRPEAHLDLYDKFDRVADYLLPNDGPLVKSTVWHWDTHASNLFVEGGKISSIIDWQDSWAGPLFLQARQPQLVDYDGEIVPRLPPHYDTLEDEDEKCRIRSQVEKSILLWSYERSTKKVNHLLHEVFHLPHGRTRRDAVDFSTNTWDTDIVPFRESLIRIQRSWDEICPGRPCPIEFTKAEIETHFRETDGWNENADFWASISALVQRDGWTSLETYDDAVDLFARLREEGLRQLEGEERAKFERETRWADKAARRDYNDQLDGDFN
ncbi:kinase-like domain-containing protein [Xylaria venustula]|nr:kinase-like domain-containing protein [Xylaria venustula]